MGTDDETRIFFRQDAAIRKWVKTHKLIMTIKTTILGNNFFWVCQAVSCKIPLNIWQHLVQKRANSVCNEIHV